MITASIALEVAAIILVCGIVALIAAIVMGVARLLR